MCMKVHDLKIKPCYYLAIENGKKPFEVRFNDRKFKVGDILRLREYADGDYTGRVLNVKITYVLDDSLFCKKGYVVLGIKPYEPFFSNFSFFEV